MHSWDGIPMRAWPLAYTYMQPPHRRSPWARGPERSTLPPGPQGLGGPMVNQGAITQCLPTAPLPICDSRQNPRVLVSEPRVWEEGNTPPPGHPLFSPECCFSIPLMCQKLKVKLIMVSFAMFSSSLLLSSSLILPSGEIALVLFP